MSSYKAKIHKAFSRAACRIIAFRHIASILDLPILGYDVVISATSFKRTKIRVRAYVAVDGSIYPIDL